MPFVDSLKRMAATLVAILQNRAELLAVEVEEEILRFFSYLILSLVALICFGVACLLAIMLVVVAFWDSYRIASIAVLMGLFGLAAVWIGLRVRNALRTKPRFLSVTLGELAKDVDTFNPASKKGPP